MYLRARYYEPGTGRFISRDPIVPDPTNSQGLNQYSYVANSPVLMTDPSGLAGVVPCRASKGGIKDDAPSGGWLSLFDPCENMRTLPPVVLSASTNPYAGGAAVILYKVAEAVRNASGTIHFHHIFPREFSTFFQAPGRNINIDAFTVPLERSVHLAAVHGRGVAAKWSIELQGRYNAAWEGFIANNPNATLREVYDFAGRLMEQFNIAGLPIVPYR